MNYYAKSNGTDLELFIYDQIGADFFGEGVTAKAVMNSLSEARSVKNITVRLNSPGGVVSEGSAIYNALVRHDAKVIIEVDGMAASAASVIAMAGDEIRMAENAVMMIHESWALAQGPASELRATADVLDKLNESIATVYGARTGKPRDTVRSMMAKETWMSASEAVGLGFATSVTPAKQLARASWEGTKLMSLYKHAPAPAASNAPAAPPPVFTPAYAPSTFAPAASYTPPSSREDEKKLCRALGITPEQLAEAQALWDREQGQISPAHTEALNRAQLQASGRSSNVASMGLAPAERGLTFRSSY